MILTRVEFEKYRSIKGEALDIERGITCLVGINEAGKSNTLSAIQKSDKDEELSSDDYSRHDDDFGNPESQPSLRLSFIPSNEQERKELEDLIGGKFNTLVLTKEDSTYTLSYPAVQHEKSTLYVNEDGELTDEKKDKIRDEIVDKIVEDFLPQFLIFDSVNFSEYFIPGNGEVSINKFIADPDAMRPVRNLLTLGGIKDFTTLVATTENDRIRRDKMLKRSSSKINEEILKVVWPVKTVEVSLGAEGDILKIRLQEENSTSPFKPMERSRGLQWALAFNTYFLAETKDELQNAVLLIDEPGIFLHVDGQKKLLENTFQDIVKNGNQIIYTTHLPYLIDPRFPERIRILEKEKEDTRIGNKAWSEAEFGILPEPVKTALGLKWSDILHLAEKNFLVEGPSDQIIFRELQSVFGESDSFNILPSYGADKMPSALALIRVENKKGFGIVDADADLEGLRSRIGLANIPPSDLESITSICQMKDIATTEDIIPEDLYRQAIFKVYSPICERRRNCAQLEINEIPTTCPRVTNTESYFAEKFKAKKHKLLKMEVARAFKDILLENPTKGSTDKWKVAKTVYKWIEDKFKKNPIEVTINKEVQTVS